MVLKSTRVFLNYLVIAVILSACNSPASAEKSNCTDDAQQYWKKFRLAVMQNSIDSVADLAQFPFIVAGGEIDATRQHQSIKRTEFLHQFPLWLIRDPGLAIEPSTMRDYINAHEKLVSGFCTPDGEQFRVGDWVFENTFQSWRFVQVYAGEAGG